MELLSCMLRRTKKTNINNMKIIQPKDIKIQSPQLSPIKKNNSKDDLVKYNIPWIL